jgi:hypothetical protein
MLWILCTITTAITTTAVMSWLQPALEGWAITHPCPDNRPQRFSWAELELALTEPTVR